MTSLGPDGFAALTGVSRETVARLEAYAELLKRWSGRINLVSRNTLGDLWRRHFLDSAQLLPLIPQKSRSLVDLGSGAGFPGLVLAILGVPGVELIESDKRKGVFLREAARLTNTPIKITDSRIETAKLHAADVVTARACAPLDKLLPLAQRFIGPNTLCLFLKGEHVADELTAAQRDWRMKVAQLPSRADPRGVILRLEQVTREPKGGG